MKKKYLKVEESIQGTTLIVPSGLAMSTCVMMPDLADGKYRNIVVEKDAHAILCEQDIRASEIIVEAGAQLDLISLQSNQAASGHDIKKRVILHDRAVARCVSGLFETVSINVSGDLNGDSSVFEHHVIYYSSQKQAIKMRLDANHSGKKTMSRTLVRGVAVGNSHTDFAGSINVAQTGSGTDAHLEHEGLLMNKTARIDSLPGLEIGTNDVRANHSSAIHFIKPEQMFYLESRGLEELEAKQTIITGFLDEMLATVRDVNLLKQINSHIFKKNSYL